MYPVSELYKSKIRELTRTFRISIQIQHSQGVLDLTDADIVVGSLTFTESTQAGEDFTVGGTVASDLNFEIFNKPEYDSIEFMGATVIATVGLEIVSGIGLTYEELRGYTYDELRQHPYGYYPILYEYVPLGIFNIDDVDRQRNTIRIKAADNMIKLDKPYSLSSLSYPATLFQIYVDACNVCDIQVGTTSFPNMDYVVQERPDDTLTFRDIVGYVAELSGTFAKCNRSGALELSWYSDSGVILTPANRFNFMPRDDVVRITGIMATVDDTTYLAGTDDYAIDLSDNPLLQGDYETVLSNIYNNIKDTAFYPFESSWQGDPALQAGDIITQVDKDGNVYNTLVTSSTYKYRGASYLSAKGLPTIAKGYKGSTNRKIAEIKRKIEKDIGDQLTTLEQAQLNATELIANMLGGYFIKTEDALYIADNPDLNQAQKVWKWGIGGFGYSSTGVDGPYTTAVTAEGSIVAMLVAAHIITADMIETGILQSKDGSTWINLDDGTFNFKDALKWVDNELSIVYDYVKIGQLGIQVLDNLSRLRVFLGNYDTGKYGLLLKDSTGDKTILDENGILQTWQEGRVDSVDSTHSLVLNVYLPPETRVINKAILRFRLLPFRAYAKSAASGGGATSGASSKTTTEAGGNHRHQMMEYLGGVSPSTYDAEDAYAFEAGDAAGGSGATFYIKSPGGYVEIYTKGASGTHSHGMDHTHSIPAHTHDFIFGIYEGTIATNVTITINGIDRTTELGGPYTTDQDSIDITSYLTAGQWNTIELGSSQLGRIDATVFIQALMGVS